MHTLHFEKSIDDLAGKLREPVVIVTVFNEQRLLPFFFEHYKKLGCDSFIVIDNNSTDRSVEIAEQHGAYVFKTRDNYKDSGAGVSWQKSILDEFCVDKWALILDADEFLMFPMCEEVSLPRFLRIIEKFGGDAVWTAMVDMYPDGAVLDMDGPNMDPLQRCRYCDIENYRVSARRTAPLLEVRGGVRERVFYGGERDNSSPPLKKTPILKWRLGNDFTHATHAFLYPPHLTAISTILLHFKFGADFAEKAKIELERGQRWGGGEQYRRYLAPFIDNDKTTFYHGQSYRVTDSMAACRAGLMSVNWDFFDEVKGTISREMLDKARQHLGNRTKTSVPHLPDLFSIWPAAVEASLGKYDFVQHSGQSRTPAKVVSAGNEHHYTTSLAKSGYNDTNRNRKGGFIMPKLPKWLLKFIFEGGVRRSEKFVGGLETPRRMRIRGWVCGINNSEKRHLVRLKVDGRIAGTTIAKNYRRDLERLGYGDGCYGFSFRLDDALVDGSDHVIEVDLPEAPGVKIRNSVRVVSADEFRDAQAAIRDF